MLSIQTKDETTSMCVNRLKKYGLTPESISKTEESKLIAMIYECNFNKRKAKHIIEVSRIIMEKGSVANTKE
jgi:endonuclease III